MLPEGSRLAKGTALYNWIMINGQMIAFFAQLVYWIGILVIGFYAVWNYKKWVNYQMGVGRSGQLRAEQESAAPAPVETKSDVSVDEFVE